MPIGAQPQWVPGSRGRVGTAHPMIRNRHILEAFERDLQRRTPNDIGRNLRILDGLVREAVALGVWPPKDPMAGMAWKIAFVQRLNVRRAPGQARPGAENKPR